MGHYLPATGRSLRCFAGSGGSALLSLLCHHGGGGLGLAVAARFFHGLGLLCLNPLPRIARLTAIRNLFNQAAVA
jgi:hypothetical protein